MTARCDVKSSCTTWKAAIHQIRKAHQELNGKSPWTKEFGTTARGVVLQVDREGIEQCTEETLDILTRAYEVSRNSQEGREEWKGDIFLSFHKILAAAEAAVRLGQKTGTGQNGVSIPITNSHDVPTRHRTQSANESLWQRAMQQSRLLAQGATPGSMQRCTQPTLASTSNSRTVPVSRSSSASRNIPAHASTPPQGPKR